MALRRFLKANQGTLDGVSIALVKGLAVNLGGGYHHACHYKGHGFCFYNDIGLAVHRLYDSYGDKIKKILIVDLDAH